jgi:glycerol-3-phosphate dehydrogenase (NAD(P)+)
MKTLVLGVWAFGIAILKHLSSTHPDETFFAYEKDQTVLSHLTRERKSPYFFMEYTFPENIVFLENIVEILPSIDLIILIIPNQFIRSAIRDMRPYLKENVTFLNLSKWIDNQTLHTVSDTLSTILSDFPYQYACLSGGMIAGELFSWAELGADIWVSDMGTLEPLRTLFESDSLTIHITPEYKNIELFGALKNIFALYVGYLEGKWYGASTVGYHYCLLWEDIKKLVPLLGWSGVLDYGNFALGWDMIATCFWPSRNKHFGRLVWLGMTPGEALQQMKEEKKHAEWFETLKWVRDFIVGKWSFPELEKIISILIQ